MADIFGLQFQIIDPTQQAPGSLFTFGLPSPRLVRGKYKLLARWLGTFFTPKGSSYLFRDSGTYFTDALRGNVVDPADFETNLHDCIEDATEQLRDIDNQSP